MQLFNELKQIYCHSEPKIWKTACVIIKDGSLSLMRQCNHSKLLAQKYSIHVFVDA